MRPFLYHIRPRFYGPEISAELVELHVDALGVHLLGKELRTGHPYPNKNYEPKLHPLADSTSSIRITVRQVYVLPIVNQKSMVVSSIGSLHLQIVLLLLSGFKTEPSKKTRKRQCPVNVHFRFRTRVSVAPIKRRRRPRSRFSKRGRRGRRR
jgi:hypothetical protein